jgi:DnaA family protein
MPLAVNAEQNFASFRTGENAELIAYLKKLARVSGDTGCWLWGEPGSGRSHLLAAVCAEAGKYRRSALYLPLQKLAAQPQSLESLEADVVCIDEVDSWLGQRPLETALMALYQRQLARQGVLVVSAGSSGLGLDFSLPDLASRLRALPVFRLQPLTDTDLVAVLKAAAHQRGLQLNRITADFWIARSRRSLPVLLAELDQLDRVSLAAQRRLTIPLLKDVLKL